MPGAISSTQGKPPAQWSAAFVEALRPLEVSELLKEASLDQNLSAWTTLLTGVVVRSCEVLGWPAAGKGHPLGVLPQRGQEYLGIDVMAFPPRSEPNDDAPRWPFPLAVFELENSPRDDRVAYSLWKVVCVRAELRVVFAYRRDWSQVQDLLRALKREVVDGYSIDERMSLGEQTLVVTGSRGEGETFPYGYFKIWRLNPNIGEFERLSGWA